MVYPKITCLSQFLIDQLSLNHSFVSQTLPNPGVQRQPSRHQQRAPHLRHVQPTEPIRADRAPLRRALHQHPPRPALSVRAPAARRPPQLARGPDRRPRPLPAPPRQV